MKPMLNLNEEAKKLFEKRFQYQKPTTNDACWLLPDSNQPIFCEFYQYSSLQDLKQRLNAVKSKLNDYGIKEWSAHTSRREPTGEISWRLKNETKAEFVTVAWCKFFECLHSYPLVEQPKLNTLHLCEAPGAFIAALNHYLHSKFTPDEIQWRWRSTTLNPYHEANSLNEMIIDDRFIYHTLENWLFHADFTGNLINVDNIKHMQQHCAEHFKQEGVHLITADGSIDCADQPDCQEELVTRLFFAEIIAALNILNSGGNFVIKMFTLFEASSVSVLYMLNCSFETVHVYKPATSKRGNSEVYVICLNYQKSTAGLQALLQALQTRLQQSEDALLTPMFGKSQIPINFLRQHEVCCRYYMNLQSEAIHNSIYAFESKDNFYIRHLHKLRSLVSGTYYKRYQVQHLPDELYLVKKTQINEAYVSWLPENSGSYTERESLKEDDVLKHMICLRRHLNQLEKLPKDATSYTHVRQSNNVQCLQISRGTPVAKLLSSLFASESVLLLNFRILETFEVDPLWQTFSKCKLSDQKVIVYLPLDADEPFYKTQQRFFITLLQNLKELQPEEVLIERFLFLTHYAVSVLLYLMEVVYESVELSLQTISLRKWRRDGNSLEKLNELLELLSHDDYVHSVLAIKQLHKNAFSKALLQYNNNILLACYRRMLGDDAFPLSLTAAAASPSTASSSVVNKDKASHGIVIT